MNYYDHFLDLSTIWCYYQNSKMELSAKTIDCIQPFNVFAKHFVLGVSQDFEYVSDKAKENPDASSLLPKEIRTAISVNSFHF